MNKFMIKPEIYAIDNFLSPQQRLEIIQLYGNKQNHTGGLLVGNETRYDTTVRSVNIKYTSDNDNLIITLFKEAITNHINTTYNINILSFELPQFLEYTIGGHYQPHWDGEYSSDGINWRKVNNRTHSILMYLNDEYTGGELVFPDLNVTHRPKAGQLLFFPSSRYFRHGVLPTTSGIRQCIVSWSSTESNSLGTTV